MAYCTLTDMEKLIPSNILINLSNDSTGATAVDTDVIAEMIDQADREIDSFLAIVMEVPVDPVPPLITNISAVIAIWDLHARKYFNNEMWKYKYEEVKKLLVKIAEGKLSIGSPEEGVASSSPGSSTTSSRRQKFNRHFWRTYR